MTTGVLVLLAGWALVTAAVVGWRRPRVWLALNLLGTGAVLGAAWRVLLGADDWEWRSGFTLGGELVHLRLDGVSALFLALLGVVGGAGAAYAQGYWSEEEFPASAPRGRAWWSALVLSMGLVLFSSNGLHFLISWELFTVCAYFLVTLDRRRTEARTAGWLYLAASHAGTVVLFAFFASLAARTGTWELGPRPGQTELAPLFWLALAGFGLKAGLFPLHIWLPSAHAAAPSHVSAILSGVALKLGIYGIVRFSGWLPVPAAAGWVVLGLGATSALFGIAFAFVQNDLKRLLAYCSVENIGVILTGVGGALLAADQPDAPWGRLVLAGAFLHVWNHGVFKALLFLAAGSVLHSTQTRELSRLGGLWRSMPWTAGLFAVGSLAASALPPWNGFVSEWLVYLGLFEAVASQGSSAWVALPAVLLLALAGALAVASLAKAGGMIFLGLPRTQAAAEAKEVGPWLRGPMLALAGLVGVLGLGPLLFWPAVARAVACWHPAWAPEAAPAPLVTLGKVQVVLAVGLVLGSAAMWRQCHAKGLRRGLTWDCGYAAPTPRMQYTSGSFSGIVLGWFRWILQPEQQVRRPRGYFPSEARRLERVPETILERIVTPVSRGILQVAAVLRRLQHGRLQFYILYLVVGLIALGVLVAFGGEP